MLDEYFNPSPSVAFLVPAAATSRPADPTGTPSSTTIDQDASSLRTSKGNGFAAALAVFVTEASQSRQHGKGESCLFDVGIGRTFIVTVNTMRYHSDVLEISQE
uniref:Uncharacterized protein n=1 Tax=Tanacetum cinerariifolium TaxID=118510 RepID=A0A6L2J4S7_TANCI|nr:hypothetical protein [Tanacetum cinerariifolium]